MKLVIFSKTLKKIGNLSLEKAGDYIAMTGFDGVDLTVHPRGIYAPR